MRGFFFLVYFLVLGIENSAKSAGDHADITMEIWVATYNKHGLYISSQKSPDKQQKLQQGRKSDSRLIHYTQNTQFPKTTKYNACNEWRMYGPYIGKKEINRNFLWGYRDIGFTRERL